MIGRYAGAVKYKELLQKKEFFMVSMGILLVTLSFLTGNKNVSFPLSDLLALGAVLLLGGPIIVEAVRGLIQKEVNVVELVSLAIIASVIAGEYQAAAIVATIMVLGSLVEQFTSQKARSAILSLMELKPEKASLLRLGTKHSEKALSAKENGSLLGFIHIQEEIRPGVHEVIGSLEKTGISEIHLLSGDRQQAVQKVAEKTGIPHCSGEMLPEDKLRFLKKIQKKNNSVAMVGDGVNDAPSLVTANVGIAMGVMGTDTAIESADIALMADDLERLTFLFRLGKQTVKTIHSNIFFALFFNLAALIASGSGMLTPVTGAITHNIGSIFVVVNSALLLKFSGEKPELTGQKIHEQISGQISADKY